MATDTGKVLETLGKMTVLELVELKKAIAVGPSSSARSSVVPAASAARRVSVFLTTEKRAPCVSRSVRSLSMSVTVSPR